MQRLGEIPTEKIYNTFNMGIGMVLAVDKNIAEDVVKYLNQKEEQAVIIGEVVKGEGVILWKI